VQSSEPVRLWLPQFNWIDSQALSIPFREADSRDEAFTVRPQGCDLAIA
jgi:hypothetical protein